MDHQINVVVVDDHVGFRDTVAYMLEQGGTIHVSGVGGSAEEAENLAARLAPDIMLLDIDMPGDGLIAARNIASANPTVTVAMLTASREARHLVAAINAGARAYILKGLSGRELAQIIDAIYAGHPYVAPALAKNLSPELARRLYRVPPCA